jgi:hypothetical protein
MSIGGLSFASTLLLLAAGEPSVAQTQPPTETSANRLTYATDAVANMGAPRSIQIDAGNGDVATLHYTKKGNKAVYEGDVVVGNADELEFAAQAGPVKLYKASPDDLTPFGYMAKSVIGGARKWPNNLVPYSIDPAYPSAGLVLQAMAAWQNATHVQFVERTAANSSSYHNYVYFTNGTDPNACYSYGVGMQGGRQLVELVDGCQYGQIVHEIGHVLGLDHEQNRSDRDKYVKVNTRNIMHGYEGAFVQRPSLYKDIGTYDYDSIMHYEEDAFSVDGQPTITALNGAKIGQRDHVSQGDISAIGTVYK